MNSANEKSINDRDIENGDFIPIEPPDTLRHKIKEPIKLIFQLLLLIFAFFPMIIWAIIKYFLARRKSVEGKVVLITGSGRGLGRGFVEEFARLGCKVACVDIDPNLNQETVKKINEKYPGCWAKAYTCNVALPSDIKALKEAVTKDFGQVDILINNAGIVGGSTLTDFDDLFMFSVINVNLTSNFMIIREFLPDMIKRNDGHFVSVASVAAFNAIKGAGLYVATKHGVFGLMNVVQRELESIPNNKVQSSVICPYFVNTSALYTKHWRIRLPELTIKETVKASVNGILKNRRIITIPGRFYFWSMFLKLLPNNYQRLVSKIFYVEVTMPPVNEQMKTPLYHHLQKSAENAELTFEKN